MKHNLTSENAQELAIKALGFIGQNQELLERFLALSGIQVQDIRQASQIRGFFAGVLAFLLNNERDLMTFCEANNIAPETLPQAFALLPGGDVIERSW